MSTTTTRTVVVDRDTAAVAAYVLDFTTSAEWDPHTVSCRRLDSGPLAVGAEYENVQHLLGSDSTLTYTVVEYEAGRRLVLKGGDDHVHTRDEITVESTDAGTEVTYTVTVELQGVATVGAPLLRPVIGRVADDGQEQLHRVLEERIAATSAR